MSSRSAWSVMAGWGAGAKVVTTLPERQEAWLRSCMSRNSDCAYGQLHGFDKVTSAADFRDRVPISDYDQLSPSIERVASGERNVLFAGSPVAFEETGGSCGGRKLIPYTAESLDDFRRSLLPWLGRAVRTHGIASGTAYWAISPATRAPAVTPGGIRIGLSDASYLGPKAGDALMAVSAVPASVAELTDVETWRLATLYWLVRARDLALVSIWSPTYFLMLLDSLRKSASELLPVLTAGAAIGGVTVPRDIPAAKRLERYLAGTDASVLWPDLRLVSCWSDGASRSWSARLSERLALPVFEPKGLLSTEAVVTVPDATGQPRLAADSGFFEFMDGQGAVHLPGELRTGHLYEVLITTSGGLYRYRTHDLVECGPPGEQGPIINFVGRDDLHSDLVGEKLTEAFVARCLKAVPGCRLLVPEVDPTPRYVLLVEGGERRELPDPSSVEARLLENPQYAYARRFGQLAHVTVRGVSGLMNRYLSHAVAGGARLGDIKMAALRAELKWLPILEGNAPCGSC